MKKTLVGRNRVDRKYYGGQQQCRKTHYQQNLSGYFEILKFFTLKFNAAATSNQDIVICIKKYQGNSPLCPPARVKRKSCSNINLNPASDICEIYQYDQRQNGNSFSSIYDWSPTTAKFFWHPSPKTESECGEIKFFKKSNHWLIQNHFWTKRIMGYCHHKWKKRW